MLSAGFEPAIPASERQQIHVLEPAATGIGYSATPPRKPENLPRDSESQSDELTVAWLLDMGIMQQICY
jgi:hypothetical protein